MVAWQWTSHHGSHPSADLVQRFGTAFVEGFDFPRGLHAENDVLEARTIGRLPAIESDQIVELANDRRDGGHARKLIAKRLRLAKRLLE